MMPIERRLRGRLDREVPGARGLEDLAFRVLPDEVGSRREPFEVFGIERSPAVGRLQQTYDSPQAFRSKASRARTSSRSFAMSNR